MVLHHSSNLQDFKFKQASKLFRNKAKERVDIQANIEHQHHNM